MTIPHVRYGPRLTQVSEVNATWVDIAMCVAVVNSEFVYRRNIAIYGKTMAPVMEVNRRSLAPKRNTYHQYAILAASRKSMVEVLSSLTTNQTDPPHPPTHLRAAILSGCGGCPPTCCGGVGWCGTLGDGEPPRITRSRSKLPPSKLFELAHHHTCAILARPPHLSSGAPIRACRYHVHPLKHASTHARTYARTCSCLTAGFYPSPFDRAMVVSFDYGGNDGFFNVYEAKRTGGGFQAGPGDALASSRPRWPLVHPDSSVIMRLRSPSVPTHCRCDRSS